MPTLICGPSRAGKTTFSKQFEKVLHADECCGAKLYEQLPRFDACEGLFLKKASRKRVCKAWENKGRLVLIWLDTPLNVCLSRGGRPEFIIRDTADKFQPPTYEEGWDEIIVIK